MHLIALTLLAITSTTLAVPHSPHGQRDLHRHIARDLAKSMRARSVLADTQPLKKRCKVRPISSSAVVPPVTPSSSAVNAPPSSSAAPAQPSTSSTSATQESSTAPQQQPSSSSAAPAAPTGTSIWKIKNTSSGNSFFDDWTFWNFADPTDGLVDYQDSTDAHNDGLVSINSAGNAVIKVDTTQTVSGNRKSIRLHHTTTFNGGLLILDAVHMPTGCATWPAFWSNGPNWPNQGEIDIIEGVNSQSYNMGSIHTGPGCSIPANFGALATLQGGTNCASAETGNGGCGQKMMEQGSFGTSFNGQGGGVYAMKWDNSGISIWYFARGAIPADIDAGVPNPDSWGTPTGNWPGTSCSPFNFFKDHFTIINTTLCGQWAGAAWSDSCAASTGFSDCASYVRAKGDQFTEAYWEIKSFKLYQSS